MKPLVINIALIVALITSIILFYLKHQTSVTDVDRTLRAMKELKQRLSPDAAIRIINQTYTQELSYIIINSLAPRRTSSSDLSADTALYVFPNEEVPVHRFLDTNTALLIWQHSDDRYYYLLTVNNP